MSSKTAAPFMIAGIIRKSPDKKEELKNAVQIQKEEITARVERDFPEGGYKIIWFVDAGVSGDDPNRPELLKFFQVHQEYRYGYAYKVDRFSRSWLGLRWFHEFFNPDGTTEQKPMLRFVHEVPEMYLDTGEVNEDSYMVFAMFCVFAEVELMKIRSRSTRGRARLKKDPELWAQKYPGRKPGSKNRRKK